MKLSARQLTFVTILLFIAAGCRSVDPATRFIARMDRAPAEERPKGWEHTKSLMSRPVLSSVNSRQISPSRHWTTRKPSHEARIRRADRSSSSSAALRDRPSVAGPGDLEALYQRYRDRAAFLFVYIQEAHPADGWQMEPNETESVIFNQPKEWGE